MKSLPHNPDLLKVAPSVIWFEPAEAALADPVRFLAYLMTYGTVDEIAVVRRYVRLDAFREEQAKNVADADARVQAKLAK